MFLLLFSGPLEQAPPRPTHVDTPSNTPANPTTNRNDDQNPKPTVLEHVPSSNPTQDHAADKKGREDKPAPSWIDQVAGFSTLAIAFFTFITIGVFIFQIKSTRDVERAWITATIEEIPEELDWVTVPAIGIDWTLEINLENHGRTPAKITSYRQRYCIIEKGQIPDSPDYEACAIDEQAVPLGGRILTPNEKIQLKSVFEGGRPAQSQIEAVRWDTSTMLAYGIIEYRDAFQRRHETRYCFTYIVTRNKPPCTGFFNLGGPAKYNRTT